MATRPIGTLGTIETQTVGGHVFTDIPNLKMLHAYITGAYYTPRETNNFSAGYAPSGVTFKLKAYWAWITAAGTLALGYADTDAGQNAGGAPTNMQFMNGSSGVGLIIPPSTATGVFEGPLQFNIPSGKYIFTEKTGSPVVLLRLWGYEE